MRKMQKQNILAVSFGGILHRPFVSCRLFETQWILFFKFKQFIFTWKLGSQVFLFYYLAVFSILIVIIVYDSKTQDNTGFACFFFCLYFLNLSCRQQNYIRCSFAGELGFTGGTDFGYTFFLMWLFVGRAMDGLGDAKLALGMGWFLGLIWCVRCDFWFWIGAVVSIFLLLAQKLNLSGKNLQIKSEIPFAPFLNSDFSPSSFSILM